MLSECAGGNVPREAWSFGRDDMGKPYLTCGLKTGPQPYFNCSHTAHVSVIAVSTHHPVGIDIESSEISADPDFLATFLSPLERHVLGTLDSVQRRRTVARFWTLKECYAKLIGTGLALDVSKLDFSRVVFLNSAAHGLICPDIELSGWHLNLKIGSFWVALAVQSA